MSTSFDSHLVRKRRNDLELRDLSFIDKSEFSRLSENAFALFSKMEKLRGDNIFCKREDFFPADFKSFLPNLTLFDLCYENGNFSDAIFRLIGTNVAEFYGENTGKSYSEMGNENASKRVWAALNDLVEKKEALAIVAEQNIPGKPYYKSEVLMIPFSDDGQVINKVLVHVDLTTTRPKP